MQQEQIKNIEGFCAYLNEYVLRFGRKPLAIGVQAEAYDRIARDLGVIIDLCPKEKGHFQTRDMRIKGVIAVRYIDPQKLIPAQPMEAL